MKKVFAVLLVIFLAGSCRSKKQVEEARKISGISTETSDIIISDSAAKETKGVRIGNSWIRPSNLILDNMSTLRNIKSFNRILRKTDLIKTVAGKGPFTLFIPTDAAFQKLNSGEIQRLLRTDNEDQRNELIKHHLVPGKIMAADLENEVVLKAADGHYLQVQNNGQTITLDGAEIIIKDGVSNNGVIHIINRVLLPEAD